MTEDLRKRLSTVGEKCAREYFPNDRPIDRAMRNTYILGFQKLSGIVEELAESLKRIASHEYSKSYEMTDAASEALRSLETFLAKEEQA